MPRFNYICPTVDDGVDLYFNSFFVRIMICWSMDKRQPAKRSTKSARFVMKSLGKAKASKFALVEGMTLNRQSMDTIRKLEVTGLKGDVLRSAINSSFKKIGSK